MSGCCLNPGLSLKTNRLSHIQPATSPLAYDPAPYRNRPGRMVASASAVAGGRTVRRPGQRRSPLPAVVERLPQGWTAPPTGCGKRRRRRRECPGRRPLRRTGCRSATGAGAFCWRCQSPGGLLSVFSIAGCVSGGILSVLTYSRPLCQAYAVGMPGSVASAYPSAHPSARG